MAKTHRGWVYTPRRSSKPQVTAALKLELETKADTLIESVLKPRHIKPPRKDQQSNYIVDIYAKWRGSTFYFYSKYAVPGPNAILPFFEDKFARMEYVGSDRFNLSYMRYTGKWVEVYPRLSVDECLSAIKDDPLFQP